MKEYISAEDSLKITPSRQSSENLRQVIEDTGIPGAIVEMQKEVSHIRRESLDIMQSLRGDTMPPSPTRGFAGRMNEPRRSSSDPTLDGLHTGQDAAAKDYRAVIECQ